MLKYPVKELLARLVILLAGLTVAHFGVTLFLLANLGADPFNVLVQGVYQTLARVTGWTFLTHGRVHIALCFVIIAALLFIDRSYIMPGTVVCMLCGGPIIDLFTLLLSAPFAAYITSFWLKLAVLAAGCVILALGMSIVIKSDAGTGPNDLVGLVISDKLHKKFGIVRVLCDLAFVLAGWLLGGQVGVGTLVCAVLVGFVADFFLPRSEKLVALLLGGRRKSGV
ncbi:MAG: YitT family protein [Clostridiales bacterium]|nr:YitT family protein [Clostridiales bacterium]